MRDLMYMGCHGNPFQHNLLMLDWLRVFWDSRSQACCGVCVAVFFSSAPFSLFFWFLGISEILNEKEESQFVLTVWKFSCCVLIQYWQLY